MAEKPSKRTAISLVQGKSVVPAFLFCRAFTIKRDTSDASLLNILLEPREKGSTQRVLFDGSLIANHTDTFTNYLAAIASDPDESAEDENIAFAQNHTFSNIIHMGRVGDRAETLFSFVSLCEWGRASSSKSTEDTQIETVSLLCAYGSLGFQVKLISELLAVLKSKS